MRGNTRRCQAENPLIALSSFLEPALIAAWFGVNPGRMKDLKNGKYGTPPLAHPSQLPPTGAPGVKGRHLRESVSRALIHLANGDTEQAMAELSQSAANYDANEP